MSIQRHNRKKGTVYLVHYYDSSARGNYRNKTFDLRKDAVAFESMVNLAKRRGDLAELDAGQETLNEFLAEWWERHGNRFLAESTRRAYKDLEARFVKPALGTTTLRRITPDLVADMRDRIIDANGDETARKTLSFLQGVLERAVEWRRLRINPTKVVKKPARSRKSRPHPLTPAEVEAVRAQLAPRDATLVSLLAYAGLRPGEALALEWEDIGLQTISVRASVSFGSTGPTKTGNGRVVRPYGPALGDARGWKLASGKRDGLVFPRRDGKPWKDTDYRNWRNRSWAEAAPDGVRPYDLRHTFASLLFAEGRNPAVIAEQMGHTVQTLLSTYVNIIEELRDAETIDAEGLIKTAREDLPDVRSSGQGVG
jgi:integrase